MSTGKIERAIFNWINAQFHARRAVNGNIIRLAGARILQKANDNVPEDKRILINFSAGWLTRFQHHWGFRSFKTHGESGDVDMERLSRSLPTLKEKLKNFNKRDLFNADESGLYYRLAPDKTIARCQMQGRKKAKTRFTFLPYCNAEGTEKFPLKIIGHANKPRCFRRKSGRELGFDYVANKKGWMTSCIFFEWLKCFDSYIGRTPGRKVALLLDNCSAHGTKETIPVLSNVEIVFLPQNTTSKLQPLDAGIIAALKMRYRKLQYELALDLVDEGVSNIYDIDQLTAMNMIQKVWVDLPGEIISNCWKHTNILDKDAHPSHGRVSLPFLLCEEEQELMSSIEKLAPVVNRLTVTDILCAEEHMSHTEEFTEEVVVQGIMQDVMVGDEAEEEEDEVQNIALPTLKEQLKSIAIVKRVLSTNLEICGMGMRVMRRLQHELRLRAARNSTQTRIDSFFSSGVEL